MAVGDSRATGEIHRASKAGNWSVVQACLQNNVSVDIRTLHTQPLPVSDAICHLPPACVASGMGLCAQADTRWGHDGAADGNGSTALMWATSKQRVEVVRELLQAGADPNATNDFGWSALEYNLERTGLLFSVARSQQIRRLLMDAGAERRDVTVPPEVLGGDFARLLHSRPFPTGEYSPTFGSAEWPGGNAPPRRVEAWQGQTLTPPQAALYTRKNGEGHCPACCGIGGHR
jgi:hypothetical protein